MAVSIYAARKLTKAIRPKAHKARAKSEQVQRMFGLGVLAKMEQATARWADAVNKKETK
jgi:hypothetical protein